MADEERPATVDEVITAIAKQHGVSPTLAKAVAERESGFDPKAVGRPVNGKNARGIFQLMPDTATELGVTDPHDPIQNITGGIKYLKQLSDKYGGDVEKMLQGYNGGPRHVDEGNVSTDAKAYATGIISKMTRQAATAAQQVSGAGGPRYEPGPLPEGLGEQRKGLLQRGAEAAWSGINPMTPEGREGIGGIAGGLLAAPGGPVSSVVGAGLGGMAAGAVNRLISGGDFNDEAGAEIRGAGYRQGAYEAVGQGVGKVVGGVVRYVKATKVGQAASAALKTSLEDAKAAYARAVGTAADTGREALQATREAATRATETATKAKAERTAAADLAAEDLRKAAEAPHAALETQPPVREQLTGSAREALGGLPGLLGEPTGPVKQALDMAGKHIAEVAKEGPEINMTGVQEALAKMVPGVRPPALFKAPVPGGRAVGFSAGARQPQNLAATIRANPTAAVSGFTAAAPSKLEQILAAKYAEALGLQPAHPLPGILAKVQAAPETLTFADTHALKKLLDESVNWDKAAKGHLEQLTKGVRVALRKELGVFEPYNAANKAYQDVIGLYRGAGAGPQFIRAATNNPDRLATFLKSGNPEAAAQVKRLLVDQSAKAGEEGAAAGQRAWDAVRDNHTYERLIKGPAEKLEERVQNMMRQSPQFVKTVYGDEKGRAVLSNLLTIGKGIREAEASGIAAKAEAAAAGTADVVATRRAGREAIRQRGIANAQDLEAATKAAEVPVAKAGENLAKMKASTMGKFMREGQEGGFKNDLAAAIAMSALHIHPNVYIAYRAVGLVYRIATGPSSADFIKAAAYAGQGQNLVKILNGQLVGKGAAQVLRSIMAQNDKSKRERQEASEEEPQAVNQ